MVLTFTSSKISRGSFIHQRLGTMTAVYHWILAFCKQHHIREICVQSAETREMANWCLKNYFIPDLNATFSMSGFIRGDYKVRF